MKVTATGLPPRWSPPLTEDSQCSLCTQCSLTSAVRSPCPIAEWDTASGPFSCPPTTRPRQLEAITYLPQQAAAQIHFTVSFSQGRKEEKEEEEEAEEADKEEGEGGCG